MVDVLILSNKGSIQKESFVALDLAHASLLDLLRGKMCEGEVVFAVLEEDSEASYAIIEDNVIVSLSSEDFFDRFISSRSHLSSSAENEFETLKRLLSSDDWPQAIFDVQIADENSEKDKDERAEGIIDIILPPLEGKKFLDFGCGEGHVANCASKFAITSVGYDIVRNKKSRFSWEENTSNLLLTNDFESVKIVGPYDVILIYDVMDHSQDSNPRKILSMAASVLADGGKIYMRTHPWTSRHGGHAYRKINKAFVHLVFTEEELKSIGVDLEHNLKILSPLATYDSWLEGSGLKKFEDPEIDQQDVEPFFSQNPIVRKRILQTFGKDEWTNECPVWQMSQCFWDYVLEKNPS